MNKRLTLQDVEWKKFKINDVFTIKKVYGKPETNYKVGEYPYISTSAINNGLVSFREAFDEKSISNANCISIDPISGKAFYHSYNFIGRGYSGASINLLYSKYLNKNIAQFIITAIEKTSREKASYGYLFNSNRLEKGVFSIPVDKQGKPNWKFMEDYIKQEQKKIAKKVVNYYQNKLHKI